MDEPNRLGGTAVDPDDIRRKFDEADREADQRTRVGQTHDRSVIGISVVGVFLMAIVALFALVILNDDWKQKAEFLVTALGSVLLPVVTLVLGYYFGTEKAAR